MGRPHVAFNASAKVGRQQRGGGARCLRPAPGWASAHRWTGFCLPVAPRAEPRPSERPDRTDHRRVEPLLTEPRQGLDAADVLRCARRLRQRNLGERGCVPVLGAFAICPALKFEPRPSTCACCDLHRRISGIIGGRAEQPDDEQMLSQLSTTSEAEQQPILQGHSSVDHRHVRGAEGVVITIRHCYLRVAHDLRLQTIS